MLKCAQEKLQSAGYAPYYLYRQKFISGGFENVGWAKSGFENLYNICIMEELCSIISMGGGASTKLVTGTGRIERIFAPKYSYEYISNIDKVISDKIKIKEFYDGLQS
jgi:oxygen-independent coproporphyrinogen-3 oxidase